MKAVSPLLNQKVNFLDRNHRFWRIGTCYKIDKKLFWCKDCLGKIYKVSADEITLYVEPVKKSHGD